MRRAAPGTLLHASNGSWATLCRPGRDRGRFTFATSDEREVTCPACRRVLERARQRQRAPRA
jgi:hypothetical protein